MIYARYSAKTEELDKTLYFVNKYIEDESGERVEDSSTGSIICYASKELLLSDIFQLKIILDNCKLGMTMDFIQVDPDEEKELMKNHLSQLENEITSTNNEVDIENRFHDTFGGISDIKYNNIKIGEISIETMPQKDTYRLIAELANKKGYADRRACTISPMGITDAYDDMIELFEDADLEGISKIADGYKERMKEEELKEKKKREELSRSDFMSEMGL